MSPPVVASPYTHNIPKITNGAIASPKISRRMATRARNHHCATCGGPSVINCLNKGHIGYCRTCKVASSTWLGCSRCGSKDLSEVPPSFTNIPSPLQKNVKQTIDPMEDLRRELASVTVTPEEERELQQKDAAKVKKEKTMSEEEEQMAIKASEAEKSIKNNQKAIAAKRIFKALKTRTRK